MIKLIAKLVDFNEIIEENHDWYKDAFGIFKFYPQKDCGSATIVLFDLLEDSNVCSVDESYFKCLQKPGLGIIKKLGLKCEIHIENKHRYKLTEYLNNLGIDSTDYFPIEYCTISFNGDKK